MYSRVLSPVLQVPKAPRPPRCTGCQPAWWIGRSRLWRSSDVHFGVRIYRNVRDSCISSTVFLSCTNSTITCYRPRYTSAPKAGRTPGKKPKPGCRCGASEIRCWPRFSTTIGRTRLARESCDADPSQLPNRKWPRRHVGSWCTLPPIICRHRPLLSLRHPHPSAARGGSRWSMHSHTVRRILSMPKRSLPQR